MDTFAMSRNLDSVIKFVSLGVVLLVPLAMPAFQPELNYAYGEYKSFILHFAAMIITLGFTGNLIIAAIRKDRVFERLNGTRIQVLRISRYAPDRVLIVGMVVLVIAFSISTLVSPLPLVSFFGGYEEFTGTNLYDLISLVIVFLAIAFKFRNSFDLKLLLIALCTGGTLVALYGLAQHFGWDELGGRQATVEGLYARSPSSFGNSLNFSAFLILTITATLSISAGVIRSHFRYVGLLVAVALGLQLASLWLGGGRGSYVGVVVALSTLILLFGSAYGWRGFLRTLAILALGSLIALLIAARPASAGIDPVSKVLSIGDQIGTITGAQDSVGQEGGLYTRSRIWSTALKLLYDPVVPQEEFVIKTELRRVYGLGPDMFVHSYPIAVSPIGFLEIQPSVHNIFLHILVTTGLLGLLALIIIGYGFLIMAFDLITRLRRNAEIQPMALLAAVFLSMVFGKIIEMQTGVSRVSDLLPTFAVFGGLVASFASIKYTGSPIPISVVDNRTTNEAGPFRRGWVLAGIAIIGSVFLMVTFIGWDVRRISATVAVYDVSQSDDPVLAGQQFLEANRRAPERRQIAFRIYETYVDEAWAARANGQLEQAITLMLKAHDVWLPLEARNPYEIGAQLALAKTSVTLVGWGREEFVDEVRIRYEKIARINPGIPSLVGTASTALASIGEYESAIRLAEQVIATEDETHDWAKAWYAKGTSKFLLGYEEEGIADLLVATEKQPGSQGAREAHSILAKIYRDRGDMESAEFHELMGSQ